MPNRILRDGILTSERVARLGWDEEVFYRRLMSVVDDYGRYYATPMLIRAACYPLMLDKVSDSNVEKWANACQNAGLIQIYVGQDGKKYIQLLDFKQQLRAKESKFPDMRSTCVADAMHMQSNAHLDVVVDVDVDGGERRPAKRGFTPPEVEDVASYCDERENGVDPQKFCDFYASKGWMVGKNKMKDWKACVRTWEKSSPKPESEMGAFV